MATQDDVASDDMAMGKYHLKDQVLSLEELYLAIKISLGERASNDLWETKLNEEMIYIW